MQPTEAVATLNTAYQINITPAKTKAAAIPITANARRGRKDLSMGISSDLDKCAD
jgi:hypothetical protein